MHTCRQNRQHERAPPDVRVGQVHIDAVCAGYNRRQLRDEYACRCSCCGALHRLLRQYLYFCTSKATTGVGSATQTPAVAAVVGHCSAFRLVSICTLVLVKQVT
jgi:hypothetical protein